MDSQSTITVKRRLIRRSAGLILVAGLICFARFLFHPEPRLLDRARFIAATDQWHLGGRFNNDIGINWLSDEDILFSRFEGVKFADRIAYRRNIRTGLEQKLPGLTEARNSLQEEVVDSQGVSPDGKWFVCSARWGDCLLAEVNGRRNRIYPNAFSDDNYDRSLFWMADSRHWLENYGNGSSRKMLLHDVDHPKSTISIPIGNKGDLLGDLEMVISPQDAIAIADPDPAGGDENWAPLNPTHPHLVDVYRLSLDTRAAPKTHYQVPVPGNAAHYELALSPKGDRIAWEVTTLQHVTTLQSSCTRLLSPFLPDKRICPASGRRKRGE
jgi:hypothetical protein